MCFTLTAAPVLFPHVVFTVIDNYDNRSLLALVSLIVMLRSRPSFVSQKPATPITAVTSIRGTLVAAPPLPPTTKAQKKLKAPAVPSVVASIASRPFTPLKRDTPPEVAVQPVVEATAPPKPHRAGIALVVAISLFYIGVRRFARRVSSSARTRDALFQAAAFLSWSQSAPKQRTVCRALPRGT